MEYRCAIQAEGPISLAVLENPSQSGVVATVMGYRAQWNGSPIELRPTLRPADGSYFKVLTDGMAARNRATRTLVSTCWLKSGIAQGSYIPAHSRVNPPIELQPGIALLLAAPVDKFIVEIEWDETPQTEPIGIE